MKYDKTKKKKKKNVEEINYNKEKKIKIIVNVWRTITLHLGDYKGMKLNNHKEIKMNEMYLNQRKESNRIK